MVCGSRHVPPLIGKAGMVLEKGRVGRKDDMLLGSNMPQSPPGKLEAAMPAATACQRHGSRDPENRPTAWIRMPCSRWGGREGQAGVGV